MGAIIRPGPAAESRGTTLLSSAAWSVALDATASKICATGICQRATTRTLRANAGRTREACPILGARPPRP